MYCFDLKLMLFCILTIFLLHWKWSVNGVVGFPWRKFVFLWESKKSPLQGIWEGIIIMHILEWVILLKLLLFSFLLPLFFFSHLFSYDFCSCFCSVVDVTDDESSHWYQVMEIHWASITVERWDSCCLIAMGLSLWPICSTVVG